MWPGCARGVGSELEGRFGIVTGRNPSESGGFGIWRVAAYLERGLTGVSEDLDPPRFSTEPRGSPPMEAGTVLGVGLVVYLPNTPRLVVML